MSYLDRTGALPEDQPLETPVCRCDGSGWIDRDSDTPRPCYACKPHLLPARRRDSLWGSSDPGPSAAHASGADRPGAANSGPGTGAP